MCVLCLCARSSNEFPVSSFSNIRQTDLPGSPLAAGLAAELAAAPDQQHRGRWEDRYPLFRDATMAECELHAGALCLCVCLVRSNRTKR